MLSCWWKERSRLHKYLPIRLFSGRKIKNKRKHLKKDTETSSFDKKCSLKPTDTLDSSIDSQFTYETPAAVVIADEQTSQNRLDDETLPSRLVDVCSTA